jgi:hypothetical protein
MRLHCLGLVSLLKLARLLRDLRFSCCSCPLQNFDAGSALCCCELKSIALNRKRLGSCLQFDCNT